ncbi:MAG: MBL fold metallo-hydrolase [Elusimicrobia bacterium]|nr:MBL fold metallo-hydrolase [Elusimicrobiota bacterium]MDE2425159.1 MBL fold metallo-hydrolase [Elusimicrobiota bacterium]
MRIGRFEVRLVSDGTFRLDGGAMYGTIPKTLWCRQEPPDEGNRILLALGALLIRTPRGRNALIDTGLSSKYDRDEKFKRIYCVERPLTLRGELKALGLNPDDVDLVVNTHLHFDHAGGDTEFGEDGKPVAAFPKARYLVQRWEWEDATHPHERNAASYLQQNFAPLDDGKRLELVDGDCELEPGLTLLRTGGHTRGHQAVLIQSEGETAIYMGDLIPTRAHVPLPYVMGYDLYPLDTLEAKRGLLTRAAAESWTVLFQHDKGPRSAKIVRRDGRFLAQEPG